jgi:hypothetical protein
MRLENRGQIVRFAVKENAKGKTGPCYFPCPKIEIIYLYYFLLS